MTCIAAVIQGGDIWMGGDRLRSNGPIIRRHYKSPKIWRVKNDQTAWLFGHAGSCPVGQILQFECVLPDVSGATGADLVGALVTKLVPALRDSLNKRGEVGKSKESGTDFMESSFLIGVQGGLFVLDSGFSVLEVDELFAAIGEGGQPAFGALYALQTACPDLGPKKRLMYALDAATLSCSGVGGQYDILKL